MTRNGSLPPPAPTPALAPVLDDAARDVARLEARVTFLTDDLATQAAQRHEFADLVAALRGRRALVAL